MPQPRHAPPPAVIRAITDVLARRRPAPGPGPEPTALTLARAERDDLDRALRRIVDTERTAVTLYDPRLQDALSAAAKLLGRLATPTTGPDTTDEGQPGD